MPSPKEILFQYWGFSSFRPVQEDVVNAVLQGKDALALLPTGGGKSICFQVPALLKDGICIVVSPLIALMKDQVNALKRKEIKAAMIFSGMNQRDIDITLDNCIYGNIKFLYISPERIKTALFIERVKKMPVNLIAVDEAHCISQWGYDFRPSYLEISALRALLPEVPMVALTATATADVKVDIVEKLALRDVAVFQRSFVRSNLSYSVFEEEDKERKLLTILNNVAGSAIVYVRSRKGTQKLARFLIQNGLKSIWYHAGLSNAERDQAQEVWIKNQVKVMVATNAFGMGIDKPDVRVVIHMDVPENLEAYYQEAGRAGRDEAKAYAVLLYQKKDPGELLRKFEQAHPDIKFIKRVYQALANYYKIAVGSGYFVSFDFVLDDFSKFYQLNALETFFALKKLEESGLIQLSESYYNPSRLYIKLNNKQLYEFQIANEPYDDLIKAILRAYGGEIFTDFITIKEQRLAQMVGVSTSEIEKKLQSLDQLDVLIYDQQKDKPQLTFIQPRFDANSLPIDKRKLKERKEIELKKIHQITAYLENQHLCRTRFLTEYFGEVNYQDCGVCDLCLNKHKSPELKHVDGSLYDQLRAKLADKALSVQQVFEEFPEMEEDELLEAIRDMLEEGVLEYDKEGKLYLMDVNRQR